MIGVMLVGAWFLIHQHCCVASAGISSRNIMVDPLMRRSPLEKNFIRFGRSWPQVHDSFNPEHIDQRDVRGKENFIRFGRALGYPFPLPKDRDWESSIPRSLLTNGDLEGLSNKYVKPENDGAFSRAVRNKQNFIRFGRSGSSLSKNKKYSGINKDNFIRFGRGSLQLENDDAKDDFELDEMDRETRDKGKAKGGKSSGFIRFGKSLDQSGYFDQTRDKRSADCSEGARCDDSLTLCKSCQDEKTWDFDPTSIVAPEFSLLPKIPFQPQTPSNKNFIRLG